MRVLRPLIALRKEMKMLRTLLQEQGVTSRESFEKYVEDHYGKAHSIPFRIVRSIDLDLDDESRIYDEVVEYERVIFDIPYVRIENSRRISFKDCVFTGKVSITQKIDNIESVYFDYCLIRGPLKIAGLRQDVHMTLHSVNCPEVIIASSKIALLYIASSHLGHFTIDDCTINQFVTFCNLFRYLDVGDNELGSVSFSTSQLLLSQQPALPSETLAKEIAESFNEFDFAPCPDYDRLVDDEGKTVRRNTFRFLLEHSDAALDRETFAQLKYLQTIAAQPNRYLRWLQVCLGAFIKPSRILALIVLAVFLFGVMFRLPVFMFRTPDATGSVVERSLSWGEAVYYSGVSFTTIGYGDITPLGWARPLAVMEGLIGILLASGYLVSLTRKYIE